MHNSTDAVLEEVYIEIYQKTNVAIGEFQMGYELRYMDILKLIHRF